MTIEIIPESLERFGELCKTIAEHEIDFAVEFTPNAIQVFIDNEYAPADFVGNMLEKGFAPVISGYQLMFEL